VHPLPSYSDKEQSANESDDDDETLDSAVSTWVKTDKTPNLGTFTGNPGVKQIPSDPTKVSQVTGLFLGDTFFDMLCEETNLLKKKKKLRGLSPRANYTDRKRIYITYKIRKSTLLVLRG